MKRGELTSAVSPSCTQHTAVANASPVDTASCHPVVGCGAVSTVGTITKLTRGSRTCASCASVEEYPASRWMAAGDNNGSSMNHEDAHMNHGSQLDAFGV